MEEILGCREEVWRKDWVWKNLTYGTCIVKATMYSTPSPFISDLIHRACCPASVTYHGLQSLTDLRWASTFSLLINPQCSPVLSISSLRDAIPLLCRLPIASPIGCLYSISSISHLPCPAGSSRSKAVFSILFHSS